MYIADLHIHSLYSRATSRQMDLEYLVKAAREKGISLLGTGDFTHPAWFARLREKLQPVEEGIFALDRVHFILTAEVCNIFPAGAENKIRKIHNVVFLPTLKAAEILSGELARYGNLSADGRPLLQMPADELVSLVKDAHPLGFVVPAHIWTPHFSLFGSNSGFDRIQDCFPKTWQEIFALETGLSSDPAMNWRLSALDNYALISNSDAHSPAKLGREVNVFRGPLNYPGLMAVLKERDREQFCYTVEYFPEEGKYHYDGHRFCGVSLDPEETRRNRYCCPRCGRRVTVGVLHRVAELADCPEGRAPDNAIPFKRMVPLDQVIAWVLKKAPTTLAVREAYRGLIRGLDSNEFEILLNMPREEIAKHSPEIAAAVISAREGRVRVEPGYDGEFGKVEILLSEEPPQQATLF